VEQAINRLYPDAGADDDDDDDDDEKHWSWFEKHAVGWDTEAPLSAQSHLLHRELRVICPQEGFKSLRPRQF
jgi:hypothetical protein